MLLASAGFNASADSLTAEFQTRLKLLGENPGKVDGAFGGKTNTAANNYFKTGNQNYRDIMFDANQTLINQLKQNQNNAKQPIFETTADFIESRNTTIVLRNYDPIWLHAMENFQASGPAPTGGVSKWYQPDITGDGVPDFVLFGMGPGHQSECKIEKCGDAWLKKPILAQLTDANSNSAYSIEVLDQDKILPGKIFNKGTGGKSIFADFNNDGYDDFYLPSEGPVAGPIIHVGGSDVLLISQGDGTYKDEAPKYDLLKNRTFQHWTAAGDIDNDGDVDFIFHNIQAKTKMNNKIACFINDGKANFTVSNCVSPPSATGTSKFYNWGGTLFDLNGDNNLDLWLSRNSRNVPIVLLGDGTGKFSSENYVEIYLPEGWPKVMRQFGYVVAADLEDDGFNEIFFSVQGDRSLSPRDCKDQKGAYCGSYVGYFKNQNGFLNFGGFIKKFEKSERGQWQGSSMIVVKDFIGDDGLKDVYLKRNYDEPFYRQTKDGSFVALKNGARVNQTQLLDLPNMCLASLETCGDIEICVSGVVIDDAQNIRKWRNSKFEQEGKRRGISCGVDAQAPKKQKQPVKNTSSVESTYEDPDWPISKRPDGTVKSKTVCHYAMDENGFIASRPMWVDEAKRRNLDKAICDFFKSQ